MYAIRSYYEIFGCCPFLYLTRGALRVTLSGVHSLVVNPGIIRNSLNVLETSSIIVAIVFFVKKLGKSIEIMEDIPPFLNF